MAEEIFIWEIGLFGYPDVDVDPPSSDELQDLPRRRQVQSDLLIEPSGLEEMPGGHLELDETKAEPIATIRDFPVFRNQFLTKHPVGSSPVPHLPSRYCVRFIVLSLIGYCTGRGDVTGRGFAVLDGRVENGTGLILIYVSNKCTTVLISHVHVTQYVMLYWKHFINDSIKEGPEFIFFSGPYEWKWIL